MLGATAYYILMPSVSFFNNFSRSERELTDYVGETTASIGGLIIDEPRQPVRTSPASKSEGKYLEEKRRRSEGPLTMASAS